jgi:GDPmannose 4,6-dehydratase
MKVIVFSGMKALIFGSSGQDGHYLSSQLKADEVEVLGVSRKGGDRRLDVGDVAGVRELIREFQPDFVFHLAATSSTAHDHLWSNHASISTGTLAVLDAVEKHAPAARVFLAGSGLQFINDGRPLDEECLLDHSSPYVIARNHSLYAARYFRQRGLKVYFGYLFHHESPRRQSSHLIMRIAEAAAAQAAGSQRRLLIGDLEARKEFGYAGDIVNAMRILVQQDELFECVIGTGLGYTVREWVQACYSHVGLDWQAYVDKDTEFRNTCPCLVSSPKRLQELGWRPVISFAELASMIMGDAVSRVQQGISNI